MQNLKPAQQKKIASMIVASEIAGTAKVNANGATNVYGVGAPFAGIDGKNREFAKGRKINLWRSPENSEGKCTINVYLQLWSKRKPATFKPAAPKPAPEQKLTDVEMFEKTTGQAAPKPAPKPAPKKEPAPALAGASGVESMDNESVNQIVASAHENGAKSVIVAVVRF